MTMAPITTLTALTALASLSSAWLPEENKSINSTTGTNLFETSSGKIRGVNLGSQFIFEPWIAESAWKDMGCENQASEFDCVSSLGQEASNKAFATHWSSWTTEDDISQMTSYGLNTIRIPVGYWLREDLVDSSEHFPQGGLDFVKKLCGWASDAGMYIIMDLHGAPGAQTPRNAFTGQNAPSAGFYTEYNYERALKWLEWMVETIYGTDEMRNVGMIEVVNEPVQDDGMASSMRENYYPQAVEVGLLFFFFFRARGLFGLWDSTKIYISRIAYPRRGEEAQHQRKRLPAYPDNGSGVGIRRSE
jgi:aryl-phospho-beta-D-glucosidase BglC (GH1 family)